MKINNLIEQVAELENAIFSDAWSAKMLEDTFKYDYNHLIVINDCGDILIDPVQEESLCETINPVQSVQEGLLCETINPVQSVQEESLCETINPVQSVQEGLLDQKTTRVQEKISSQETYPVQEEISTEIVNTSREESLDQKTTRVQGKISSQETYPVQEEISIEIVNAAREESLDQKTIAGYIIYSDIDGVDLERIAVRENMRNKGFAAKLMNVLINTLDENGRIILEVRAGNTPAIKLYERFDFKMISCRKGYYTNPVEDAWIMEKVIRSIEG